MKAPTGFRDSLPLLDNRSELIARFEEDGFLYFKRLLPTSLLLELRIQILEILSQHGWVKQDTNLADGIADTAAIEHTKALDESMRYIGVTRQAYREIQCLELFHAIAHDERLLQLYRTLFQTDAFPHPRHIARVLLPARGLAPTPPHQDYVHIQGTHRFWTCWIPLGDCPLELGGLSVLHKSHRMPILDVTTAAGAGGVESILCGEDKIWLEGNFACGDLITFPSHTVHRGLPNLFPDRIRLSCDLRYQPVGDKIEEKSLQPHLGVATWEEIYKHWSSDQYQYYWKPLRCPLSKWDASLRDPKEKLC